MRREDAVVHVVVVVVRLNVLHGDLLEELDHPAANEARDDNADREAVVRCEVAPVALVSNHHVVGRVHEVLVGQACPVAAILALGQLALGATEGDVLGALCRGLDSANLHEVAELDAGPVAGAGASWPPVEADGLGDHVLLLAAVSGADKGDRNGNAGKGHDLVHGERARLRHGAVHSDLVLRPLDARDGAVVAHVVVRHGGDEAVVHEIGQLGLAIERMAAREADERGVAGHPGVGGPRVLGVDVLDDVVEEPVGVLLGQSRLRLRAGRHGRKLRHFALAVARLACELHSPSRAVVHPLDTSSNASLACRHNFSKLEVHFRPLKKFT